ncbi:MAG: phenylacetate--CoA ligase family protein [Firmicutes bacterium]|nr:phenylacetate--CoA ligase family protein [Bacillota bacterium]
MNSRYEKRMAQVKKPAFLDNYFSGSEFPDQGMPQETLTAFQRDALIEIATLAYNQNAFYREKMMAANVKPEEIKSLEDLSKLPFLTKEELRGHPWILLTCDKKDISIICVSTGTTGGGEIYIPNTWRDYYLNEMATGYPELFPIDPGDICINALPYEMSSAGMAFHKTFADGCLATVIPAGKGGAYSTPEKTVRVMRDLKPTVVITTPPWAISIAEAAEEAGFNLRSLPLKKMWLTGEGCSFAFRDRVEKLWGTTANLYYGSLECGGIGIECDRHNGYHLISGHVIVEIVDPETGAALEPGEIGEIVATCLLRYDTPVIRYRTRDLGYVDPDPCPCGVNLPRLFLRGRLVDQLEIQGVSLSPYYLEEFLMRLPEVGNWYQFVVKRSGATKLKVRAELAKGLQPSPELADKLASKMEYAVGIPCEFELVDRMPRTGQKAVRVLHEED